MITPLCLSIFLFVDMSSETIVTSTELQTVKQGSRVNIKCSTIQKSKQNLVWYKQRLSKMPKFVVRLPDTLTEARFSPAFVNRHLSVDKDFNLNIKAAKHEDEGTYFCGKMQLNIVEFGPGTQLMISDDKLPMNETTHKPFTQAGEDVSLQCTVHACRAILFENESIAELHGGYTRQMKLLVWLSLVRIGALLITALAVFIIVCNIKKT